MQNSDNEEVISSSLSVFRRQEVLVVVNNIQNQLSILKQIIIKLIDEQNQICTCPKHGFASLTKTSSLADASIKSPVTSIPTSFKNIKEYDPENFEIEFSHPSVHVQVTNSESRQSDGQPSFTIHERQSHKSSTISGGQPSKFTIKSEKDDISTDSGGQIKNEEDERISLSRSRSRMPSHSLKTEPSEKISENIELGHSGSHTDDSYGPENFDFGSRKSAQPSQHTVHITLSKSGASEVRLESIQSISEKKSQKSSIGSVGHISPTESHPIFSRYPSRLTTHSRKQLSETIDEEIDGEKSSTTFQPSTKISLTATQTSSKLSADLLKKAKLTTATQSGSSEMSLSEKELIDGIFSTDIQPCRSLSRKSKQEDLTAAEKSLIDCLFSMKEKQSQLTELDAQPSIGSIDVENIPALISKLAKNKSPKEFFVSILPEKSLSSIYRVNIIDKKNTQLLGHFFIDENKFQKARCEGMFDDFLSLFIPEFFEIVH